MRNIAIVVEYRGYGLNGWQSQKNGITVQDELERALKGVLGHDVRITGSGRTDSGVSARGQVANFYTQSDISCYKLPLGVNIALPDSIAVKKCLDVPESFNARKDAVKKTYIYRVYSSPTPSPIRRYTHAQVYKKLDAESMQKAAVAFVGKHDFRGFMSTGSNELSTVREIYECDVVASGDEISIIVTGNAFLYNMVRIMSGALVRVGQGKIKAEDMAKIIDAKDRRLVGKTLPPEGLTLEKVYYDIDGLR